VVADCDEDVFSFSMSYARTGDVIVFNDEGELTQGTVSGTTISVAVEGEFDLEAENSISTSKDVTLVYRKQ
jgi:hypothetical protein